jgi:hypothetical protein
MRRLLRVALPAVSLLAALGALALMPRMALAAVLVLLAALVLGGSGAGVLALLAGRALPGAESTLGHRALVKLEVIHGDAEVAGQALGVAALGPESALFPRPDRGRVDTDPAGHLLEGEGERVPLLRLEAKRPDAVHDGERP